MNRFMSTKRGAPSTFFWHGITCLGEPRQGILNAKTRNEVTQQLRAWSIIGQKIIKKRPRSWCGAIALMTQQDLLFWVRHMHSLLDAHIPLRLALTYIPRKKHELTYVVDSLILCLDQGYTLHEALAQHPRLFSMFFCHLIHVGEQTGQLSKVFELLLRDLEKQRHCRQAVKKAVRYPLFVLLLGLVMTMGLCVFVMPQFITLFHDMGAPLPRITRILLAIAHGIQQYGLLGVLVFTGLWFALHQQYKQKSAIRSRVDRCLLSVPLVASLQHHLIMARYTYTLALAQDAGLSFVDALYCAASITQKTRYVQAMKQLPMDIQNGHDLVFSCQKTLLFDDLDLHLIQMGVNAGHLAAMFHKLSIHYTTQLENKLGILIQCLEPAIMSLLGVLIGSIVLGLYLPLLNLGSLLST